MASQIYLRAPPANTLGRPSRLLQWIAIAAALSWMSSTVVARQADTDTPATNAAAENRQANVARGKQLFQVCASCHEVGERARAKIGPPLTGIVGRRIASHLAYDYSTAMTKAGRRSRRWTITNLKAYLKAPATFVPGNKMAFAGLRSTDDRRDLIAYLTSLTLLPERSPAPKIGQPVAEAKADADAAAR